MKRQILAVVACLSMVFALGCDQETNEASSTDDQVKTQESTQSGTPASKENVAAAVSENIASVPTGTVTNVDTVKMEIPAEVISENIANVPTETVINVDTVKMEIPTPAEIPEAAFDATQPEADGSALCTVSGAAGTTADCLLNIAAEADAAVATGLQATLNFDSSVMTFEGFYRAGAKVDQGGVVSERGHVLRYGNIAEVADGARMKLMVLKFNQPFESVTDADEAAPAELVTARFSFKSDVRGDSPSSVHISGVTATSPEAQRVATRVEGNMIVTGGIAR